MVAHGCRYLAADSLEAARARGYRAVADLSAAMLPITGTRACAAGVSLFVEVPYASVTHFESGRVLRTELRARNYASVILSVPDTLYGPGQFGFLLAYRPLVLVGDEYQPEDSYYAIAVVDGALPTSQGYSEQLLGPNRCNRCNYTIPAARVRAAGAAALCVRCKTAQEMRL